MVGFAIPTRPVEEKLGGTRVGVVKRSLNVVGQHTGPQGALPYKNYVSDVYALIYVVLNHTSLEGTQCTYI
jgi:hypothetical protein